MPNIGLNPKFRFDTFGLGPENEFAHAAALAISKTPSKAYNPLYLYGPPTLGKTHLLHALAHEITAKHPDLDICHLSAGSFKDQLDRSLNQGTTEHFRQLYNTVDVFILDDLNYLKGDSQTQEIFFQIFSSLLEKDKQIVLAGHVPPTLRSDLDSRLTNLFHAGLVVDMRQPSYETRVAILQKKSQIENCFLPAKVLHFIAGNFSRNILELEGALRRLSAYASLMNKEITLGMAKNLLTPEAPPAPNTNQSPGKLLDTRPDFQTVREHGNYVDKTMFLQALISQGGSFFLSRPRRFGKSLLLSTLKAAFEGKQALFKDLWLHDKIDWQKRPVIHFDLSSKRWNSLEDAELSLKVLIENAANSHDIKLKQTRSDLMLEELIQNLAKQRTRVAVLIDEYDHPFTSNLDNPELMMDLTQLIASFFGNFKSLHESIHLLFLTGVSKFAKVSVFSGLNQVVDLTLDPAFATVLGYTQDEIVHYFRDEIKTLEGKHNLSHEETMALIADWYNGFSWDGKTRVYNPYSIMHLFHLYHFRHYWYETGTPSYLVQLFRNGQIDLPRLEHIKIDSSLLEPEDPRRVSALTQFFHTGYLTVDTITTSDDGGMLLSLKFPNFEVRQAMLTRFLSDLRNQNSTNGTRILIDELVNALVQDDLDTLRDELKQLFASIPYQIFINNLEAYYHTVVFLVFSMIGLQVEAEVQTNRGRIDATVVLPDHIYIFEFKMGKAEPGMNQIIEKGYVERFIAEKKPITLISAGFEERSRNIGDWLVQPFTG
nr:AAA family ATPase [Acanthopleuribacter pedis]